MYSPTEQQLQGKSNDILYFLGLECYKKEHKPRVKKDIFGKMFGAMLPSDSRHLKLSKMNMGGLGTRMMRYLMGKKI